MISMLKLMWFVSVLRASLETEWKEPCRLYQKHKYGHCNTIRDLDFLEEWRWAFEDHHLTIVQDGDPSREITVPHGYDYDLYDLTDIKDDLGDDHWIISKRDSACRCYGFLKADSEYVYTIACQPRTPKEIG